MEEGTASHETIETPLRSNKKVNTPSRLMVRKYAKVDVDQLDQGRSLPETIFDII